MEKLEINGLFYLYLLYFNIDSVYLWICVVPGVSCKKLLDIFHTFHVHFPMLQYYFHVEFWGFAPVSKSTYLLVNMLLLCVNTIFMLRTHCSGRSKNVYRKKIIYLIATINGKYRKNNFKPYGLIIISLTSILLWVMIYGIPTYDQYLYRNAGSGEGGPLYFIVYSTAASLLLESVRYIPFASFVYYKLYFPKKLIYNIFFLILILLSCPPTAMARFMSGTIYGVICILFFPRLLLGYGLHILIILGLLIVFPLADGFRVLIDEVGIFNHINFEYLYSENYDTYATLLWVIEANIITFGYQLLGVILFFVPRVLWEYKPIGSGAYLSSEVLGQSINISFNFYAEAFINFWYFGVIIYSYILASFVRAIDNIILYSSCNNEMFSKYIFFFPVMIMYIFYVLRGDMLSSVSYLLGLIVAFFIVSYFIPRDLLRSSYK